MGLAPYIPNTTVRTSHSLTIRANNQDIGLINSWNPTQQRTITAAYQIGTFVGNVASGEPVEKVPGNVTGMTVAIQRYDIYVKKMEDAFGTADLIMLSNQLSPFSVVERWSYPDSAGALAGSSEMIEYIGCWFSSLGRNFRSDGDRIVNVNGTLEYTRKRAPSVVR